MDQSEIVEKEDRSVKRFICLVFLFVCVPLCIIVFPLVLFWASGEFMSPDNVRKLQQDGEPLLYGKSYLTSGVHRELKLASILDRKPEILALGASRTLQIRSNFFSDDVTFYNGGGLIGGMQDYLWVLKQLPKDDLPKVLLMELNQPFFNPVWYQKYYVAKDPSDFDKLTIREIFFGWRTFFFHVYQGKYAFENLVSVFKHTREDVTRVGLGAKLKGTGTFNDGSYDNGSMYHIRATASTDEDVEVIRRIDGGLGEFEHASAISTTSLQYVDMLLKFAHENDIHVVGFLPPYAHSVYERLNFHGEKFAYIHDIEPNLRPRFARYGFTVHNFIDLQELGATDRETIDGAHASEKAYVRMIIRMAEADPVLNTYVDVKYLTERLDAEESDLEVFRTEL